jgi:hypothetical protein
MPPNSIVMFCPKFAADRQTCYFCQSQPENWHGWAQVEAIYSPKMIITFTVMNTMSFTTGPKCKKEIF